MSLNFVSTTVLSSTDGVSHDTETRLESSSNHNNNTSTSENYKPLYEQLRQNAQEEQDKYDEITKALRGTRALDDEDVAHLQSVEDERNERLRLQVLKEKEELESFRLAKLDYQEATKLKQGKQYGEEEDDDSNNNSNKINLDNSINTEGTERKSLLTQLKPKITITKKRRRQTSSAPTQDEEKLTKKAAKDEIAASESKHVERGDNTETRSSPDKNDTGGLSGLLGGYGSDSDSD